MLPFSKRDGKLFSFSSYTVLKLTLSFPPTSQSLPRKRVLSFNSLKLMHLRSKICTNCHLFLCWAIIKAPVCTMNHGVPLSSVLQVELELCVLPLQLGPLTLLCPILPRDSKCLDVSHRSDLCSLCIRAHLL